MDIQIVGHVFPPSVLLASNMLFFLICGNVLRQLFVFSGGYLSLHNVSNNNDQVFTVVADMNKCIFTGKIFDL